MPNTNLKIPVFALSRTVTVIILGGVANKALGAQQLIMGTVIGIFVFSFRSFA